MADRLGTAGRGGLGRSRGSARRGRAAGRGRAAAAFGLAPANFVEVAVDGVARRTVRRDAPARAALGLEPLSFAFSAVDFLDFDFLDFDFLGFEGVARAFAASAVLGEACSLRVITACAALAFLLACLAAFLPAFANFRARLSTNFAARSACFRAPACAAAFFAAALNRCAAAPWFAGGADESEVATI